MAIILIDDKMRKMFPRAINLINQMINLDKIERINNIEHLHFNDDRFARNEIVLARLGENENGQYYMNIKTGDKV